MRRIGLAVPIVVVCLAATGRAQVTTSGGEIVSFTQKNVVNHMIIADSLEVEAAQLAVTRTQNTAVRDFANMLVTDHNNHLNTLRKLAGKSDIGREPNANDKSGPTEIRALTQLRAMPADSNFDRDFVRNQIRLHESEIATLKSLRAAAKDDDLQKDIDQTQPVLERHLAKAKEVAAQLGIR